MKPRRPGLPIVLTAMTAALLLTGCATTGPDRSTTEANAYTAGLITGAVIAHNAREDAQPNRTLKNARREADNTRSLLWLSFLNALFGNP